jgi:hypothetical protein
MAPAQSVANGPLPELQCNVDGRDRVQSVILRTSYVSTRVVVNLGGRCRRYRTIDSRDAIEACHSVATLWLRRRQGVDTGLLLPLWAAISAAIESLSL